MPLTSFPIETTPLSSVTTRAPARTIKLLGHTASGAPGQFPLADLISVYNVKHYGALGDGTTDDKDAIAACIAAAPAGSTILFPQGGTFITSTGHTLATAGVTVIGYGATLKASSVSVRPLTITAPRVSVFGLTLDGAHNGTGTPPGGWEGLLNITGATSTVVEDVTIDHCRFINSNSLGIRVLGNVSDLSVSNNRFSANFIHFFAEPSYGYTYKNITGKDNKYGPNWYTDVYSGSIKMKGDIDNNLHPTGLSFENEKINSSGEMGIEIWGGCNDSSIVDCKINGPRFGVSLNNAENVVVIACIIRQNAYCGIELADTVHHCKVIGNTIHAYSSGATRGGQKGIVSSGPACTYNAIEHNTIRGVAGEAINLMDNHHGSIKGNYVFDSNILLGIKNASYMSLTENHLYGPCTYHVFLDYNDIDSTDIAVTRNTLYGAASADNIILYSGVSGRTVTNCLVTNNNLKSATFGNHAFNVYLPGGSAPNLQFFDNEHDSSQDSEFAPIGSTPAMIPAYRSTIQRSGLSVSAKRSITAAPNGSPRWIKIFDASLGKPLFLQLHIEGSNNNESPTQNSLNAIIASAPYNFDASITLLPSGNYYGSLVSEIIYTNSDGYAQQQVWLKLRASSDTITLDLYFSDYAEHVVVSPSLDTTEPTWADNSYHAQIESGVSTAFQARSFYARDALTSAPYGSIPNEGDRGGRLHIRGAGTTSYNAQQRIARFDLVDGTEAVGITPDGVFKADKKLSVAGVEIASIKSIEALTIDFGTINAGSTFAYDVYCGGVTTANTPAGFFSFEGGISDDLLIAPLRVTATDTVRLVVRNPTASNITVGTKKVRAVVFQF